MTQKWRREARRNSLSDWGQLGEDIDSRSYLRVKNDIEDANRYLGWTKYRLVPIEEGSDHGGENA